MAAIQTSVAAAVRGFPGLIADSDQAQRIASKTSEESSAEIPFGVCVCRGTTYVDEGALLLNTSAAAMDDKVTGIVAWRDGYAKPTELGDTGLKPGVQLCVLQRGRIWVQPEENVAPGDPVRVRAVVTGNEVKGAFRTSADSTDCVDISKFARWITTGTASVPAILEVDFVGEAQALADS